MAVAVKKGPEVDTGLPALGLAAASVVGTLFVVLGFGLVYHGIRWLWLEQLAPQLRLEVDGFVSLGILLLLIAGGVAGLIFLWKKTLGRMGPPGTAAGTALGVLAILGGFLLLWLAGWITLAYVDYLTRTGAMLITAAAGVIYCVAIWRNVRQEKFDERLQTLEDQGWFTATIYKKGQGLRTRRGTMFGIWLVVAAGLWVFALRGGNLTGGSWTPELPFLGKVELLWWPALTVSLGVAALTAWVGFRLANYPRFADFLIATEAEMNKVSWSTRKRIIQDTVVVLTTLALLTIFLYLMDVIWARLLTWIGVVKGVGN